MVPLTDRSAQRFPRLHDAHLAMVRRFADGPERDFIPGEAMFQVGERAVSAWFVLKGRAGTGAIAAALRQRATYAVGRLRESASR